MISYKEFLNKRNEIIREGFKDSDMDKVFILIRDSINKHISKHITALHGTENTKVDTEYMITKYYLVGGNNVKMFGLNFLRSSNSNEVYSIDFFNNYDILLTDKPVKTSLSLYTLGSSIVYFLPVIWTIINADDVDITNADINRLGKEIYVKECKSFEFSVGALIYSFINNLKNTEIKEAFVTESKNEITNAREFRKYKEREKVAAYAKRNDSKENNEKYKRLLDELKEVWDAIRGGATSLPELKAAIKRNVSVIAEIDEIMKRQQSELETESEDPEFVFKKMRKYVNMVIKGINPSVILCGAPGTGKTYNVKQQLKAAGYREGANMYTIKGRCSARQLYMTLYQYRAKGDIVIIDDADVLVGPRAPEDCIDILKGALDSSGDDEGRLVMYGVTGKLRDDDGDLIPKKMYYNGSIIIITNYNVGALDTALRGRSFVMDINFTTDDLLKIVKKIMPAIDPEHLSSSSKMKAYEYLQEMADKKMDMEISIRTFAICAKIFETCADDPEFTEEDVRKMIADQMRNQARRAGRNSKY